MKLTKTKITAANKKGRYGDGRGLWLVVGPNGRKSWAFLFSINKRHRHMGLGSVDYMNLDEARDRALELRRLVKRGIDPLAQLQAERAANQDTFHPSAVCVPTFDEVAEQVRDLRVRELTNEKHKKGWLSSLSTYVYPHARGVPVDQLKSADFLAALENLRLEKPDTARKLRFKILNVLDHAARHDWIDEAKLAKIRRDLNSLKIKRSKNHNNYVALPYADLPPLIGKVRDSTVISARALHFLILTGARSEEARRARWREIDMDTRTWTIPKERMKTRERDHVVPLSEQALVLLRSLYREENSDLLFPSPTKAGQPVSDMMLLKIARSKSGRSDIHVHGLRASLRTWVAEQTNYPSEVAEAALAHVVPSEVERAYKRTTFFDKRRELMAAWADYCYGQSGDKVVALRA